MASSNKLTDSIDLNVIKQLLDSGIRTNYIQAVNNAIRNENPDLLKLLLSYKTPNDNINLAYIIDNNLTQMFDIMIPYSNAYTSTLNYAIRRDNTPMAEKTMKYMSDKELSNIINLKLTIQKKDSIIFNLLLPYIVDYEEALMYAIEEKSDFAERILLHIPINERDNPVFLQKAISSRNVSMVKTLLQYYKSIPDSVIQIAIKSINMDILKTLLKSKILTDSQTIVLAVVYNNKQVYENLLRKQITKDMLLNVAMQLHKSINTILYLDGDITLYTLESDGSISPDSFLGRVMGNEDYTMSMIPYLPLEIVNILFRRGTYENINAFINAGINLADFPDMFILYIGSGYDAIASQFIQDGVNVHYQNEEPLITAVLNSFYNDNTYLIIDLISAGVDITARNNYAYRLAKQLGCADVVQLLGNEYVKLNYPIPNTFTFLENINQCKSGSHVKLATLEPHISGVLGYGNPIDGYVCFSLSDLTTLWMDGDFRNPYNLDQVFDKIDILTVHSIIDYQEDTEHFDMDDIMRFNYFMINYQLQETILTENLEKLKSVNDKTYLRQLFVYLFAIGMYFRQWKGPGYAYPLANENTGKELREYCEEETYLLQTIKIIHLKYNHALNELRQYNGEEIYNIYQSLRSVNIFSGKLDFQGESISYIYDETIKRGATCIRISSNSFVISGAYYLQIILNELIPGYRLGDVIDDIA